MSYQDEDEGSELEQQQEMLLQQQQEMEQQEAEEQKMSGIRERILKNKLKFICMNLAISSRMTLNVSEKKTMKDAKKFPNLKSDIKKVTDLLLINKGKVAMKAMSAGPIWYYVGIGCLIILVIIIVITLLSSVMAWLIQEDSVNSAFGITGKDFYGARMVYKDDDLAAINMVENYVELVENGIDEINKLSIQNATLEVNITVPEDNYDYSTFNESEFQANYPVLHSTVFDIAKEVYKVDNSTEFSGASLIECANGILYFGCGEIAIVEIQKIVENVIINNKSITQTGENSVDVSAFNSQISSQLALLYGQEKYKIRTEKLFVKDYILEGEEDRMQNIAKENYVAFIFMAKNNVKFTKFSFSVGGADLSEFSITLTNNGNEVGLKKDDIDYSDGEESTNQTFIYIADNVNIMIDPYSDINQNDLTLLSDGLSLFDIVNSVEDYSIYLQQNENEIQTVKKNGVVVELNNKEAFNFVEFETIWE